MIVLLLVLIAAVSFLFYPLAYEEFETPKAFALTTFGCIAFFTVNWKKHHKDRLAQAIVAIIISAAVSTYLSIDKHVSLWGNVKAPMGLFVIVSLFLVYLVSREVMDSELNINSTIDTLIGCGVGISIYTLMQACKIDFQTWNGTLKELTYTRPMATLGHPNFMANYLAMVLPFALYRMDSVEKFRWKALLGLVCAVMVAAIFASISRGMIIAAFIGAIGYFVLSKRNLKKIASFIAATLVISSILLVSIPGFRHDAIHRMDALLSPGLARPEYPKGAIRIWEKSPWFGSGTDTFEISFRNARSAYYWKVEKGGSPHRAHNDFLNILATQGLFGALMALLLTTVVLIYSIRSKGALAAASIASIVVFYVAGLTSFILISTGTIFMISLAILKSQQRDLVSQSEGSIKACVHGDFFCFHCRKAIKSKSPGIYSKITSLISSR